MLLAGSSVVTSSIGSGRARCWRVRSTPAQALCCIITDVTTPGLSLTGERTLPGIWHENYWFQRHAAAYLWLLPHVLGRRVLEAGCGEGYGAELLAGTAAVVLALDYDDAALRHVRAAYPSTPTVRGNLVALPLADKTVDAVVSLQTIEHLWDQPRFVAECVRVLRPGGLLVLTTPNRLTFSPGLGRGEKPLNPFHSNELDAAELVELLAAEDVQVEPFGLWHGTRIRTWERTHGSLIDAQLATPAEHWSADLAAFVASLDAGDFEIRPSDEVTAGQPHLPGEPRRVTGHSLDDSLGGPLDDSLDLVMLGRVW